MEAQPITSIVGSIAEIVGWQVPWDAKSWT
jgi:hypothetical protein